MTLLLVTVESWFCCFFLLCLGVSVPTQWNLNATEDDTVLYTFFHSVVLLISFVFEKLSFVWIWSGVIFSRFCNQIFFFILNESGKKKKKKEIFPPKFQVFLILITDILKNYSNKMHERVPDNSGFVWTQSRHIKKSLSDWSRWGRRRTGGR